LNILLINYEYPPIGAGAASSTYHIGQELTLMGHKVTVLTSSYKDFRGWSADQGIEMYRCRSIRRRDFQSNLFEMMTFLFSAFFCIGKIIKKQKTDGLIVFFSFPCGPLGLLAKLFFKKPYVISLRGGDVPGAEPGLKIIHFLLSPLRRLVLKNSIAITANSTSLKNLSEKTDRLDVKVISNGIDTSFFEPSTNKKPDQVYRFIFSGRFQPQKNLFYLLDRFTELKETVSENFELHLVGDGYLKDDIINHIKKLEISDQVVLHPWQTRNELKKLYQNSNCFVITSLYEGMSNVVLEAMACGLPVIASNVTGNSDLIRHQLTGYLFDLEKPGDFLNFMNDLITDPDKGFKMGEEARKLILKEYSWEKCARLYIELFQNN
jgi:glycosyltransferase involved in cell wall biosynthesis